MEQHQDLDHLVLQVALLAELLPLLADLFLLDLLPTILLLQTELQILLLKYHKHVHLPLHLTLLHQHQ